MEGGRRNRFVYTNNTTCMGAASCVYRAVRRNKTTTECVSIIILLCSRRLCRSFMLAITRFCAPRVLAAVNRGENVREFLTFSPRIARTTVTMMAGRNIVITFIASSPSLLVGGREKRFYHFAYSVVRCSTRYVEEDCLRFIVVRINDGLRHWRNTRMQTLRTRPSTNSQLNHNDQRGKWNRSKGGSWSA